MPVKKKGSGKKKKKGKGGKGKKKGGSAKSKGPPAPAAPPNYNGIRPGGVPIKVLGTDGKELAVAEVVFSTILDLKQRICEVSSFNIETLHLFTITQEPVGRPVADLEGYSESWVWDPYWLIEEHQDEAILNMIGVKADSQILLLVKNQRLRRASSFVAQAESVSSRPSTVSFSRRPSAVEMYRNLRRRSSQSIPTQNSVARGLAKEHNAQLEKERHQASVFG